MKQHALDLWQNIHISELERAQRRRLFSVTHNLAFSASISSLSSLNCTTLPTCSSSNRTYTGSDVFFERAHDYGKNIIAHIEKNHNTRRLGVYLLPLGVTGVVI